MSTHNVGTEPVVLGQIGEAISVQNLGPGTVYLDTRPDVSEETGTRVVVDAYFEFPRDLVKPLYAVSTELDTDVRVMVVG